MNGRKRKVMKNKLVVMIVALILGLVTDESTAAGKDQISGRYSSHTGGPSHHSHQRPSRVKKPGGVSELDTLIARLRKSGRIKVQRGGEVSQPFFTAKGRLLKLDGEDVQVFEYPTEEQAGLEAGRVAPGGSGVGTSMPMWIAPPHFYRTGRLIALYVGENGVVISALENALGPQFAGK